MSEEVPSQLEHKEDFLPEFGFQVETPGGLEIEIPSPLSEPIQLEFIEEEEKEQQVDIPELEELTEADLTRLRQLLTHIEPVPEANIPSFNRDLLNRVIEKNLNQFGVIENKDAFQRELGDVIEQGLKSGLTGEITLKSVVSTIGNTLKQHPELSDQITVPFDKALLSRISPQTLDTFDVNRGAVPSHVQNIFRDDIRDIAEQKEVDINDIRQVVREFETDLRKRLLSLEADLTFNDLGAVIAYIDDHVIDDALKENLKGKATEIFNLRSFRDGVNVQRGEQLQPLSGSKVMIMGVQPRLQMANTIIDQLQEIQELDERKEITKREGRKRVTILKNEIENLARVAQLNVDLSSVDPTVGGGKTIRERLRRAAENLQDITNVRITYIRPINEDGDQINISQLVGQLKSDLVKKTISKPRHEKSSTEPRAKFKNITPNIVVTNIAGNKKEIEISSSASMEELLVLSSLLISESGSIRNIDDEPLLEIVRGLTEVKDIIAILVNEQKHNAAKTVRLLYVPNSHVGGNFIGGFLSNLRKKKLNKQILRPNMLHSTAIGGNIARAKEEILQTPFFRYHHPVGVHEPPFNEFAKGRKPFHSPSL